MYICDCTVQAYVTCGPMCLWAHGILGLHGLPLGAVVPKGLVSTEPPCKIGRCDGQAGGSGGSGRQVGEAGRRRSGSRADQMGGRVGRVGQACKQVRGWAGQAGGLGGPAGLSRSGSWAVVFASLDIVISLI